MLSIFSCAYWPFVWLLWRNVYLGFCPFFDWVVWFFSILSCMSCLYILEINSLSVSLFANIFSHSVGCLFVLLMVSSAVQKLVSLIRSHLFIFDLISFALRDWSKTIFLQFMSQNVHPCSLLGVLWFPVLYVGL